MFFAFLEKREIAYNKKHANLFFWFLTLSCVPAYALSTLWALPPQGIHAAAWIAALMQLAAIGFLIITLKEIWPALREKTASYARVLYGLAALAFVIKYVLQFLSVFDWAIELAYMTRNFVIAYMHPVFIGVCSFFLLGFFIQTGWLSVKTRLQRSGLWLFISAFFLSELVLVIHPGLAMIHGVILPGYNGL